MQCPRLDHFVRFNYNGTVSRCGHMINAPQFQTLEDMEKSDWLSNVKLQLKPKECARCFETELANGTSIRINAIKFHQQQNIPNYLSVGGVLDNVCNSACFTCDENHSTRIGSLTSKIFPIVDNSNNFWKLPLHRIVHLDINGGEPSASKNYKNLLKNLPSNIKSIRVNTNGSIFLDEVIDIINKGIKVTVTVSLDGINEVHDFVRWPIKWKKFYHNLLRYKSIPNLDLNTWTTISALNIGDFENIEKFVADNGLNHSYAFLHYPDPINVKYKNKMTEQFNYLFPNLVATDKNNQEELDSWLIKQKHVRDLE